MQSFREESSVAWTTHRVDLIDKGEGSGKSKTYGDSTRAPHHVSNHATDVTAGQKVGSSIPVIICKLCNKGHDLDDYQAYLKRF